MRATVRLAKAHGVKVGAHPSLPDLQGFGRREMKIGREELANCLIYQIGALKGFLDAEGMALNHIKPHGSLYGMAARDEEIANAVCDAADVFKVPLLGMVGTDAREASTRARGHRFLAEYYADLDYADDGALIITREHDADRSRRGRGPRACAPLREGMVRSVGGKDVKRRRRDDLRPFRHARRPCRAGGARRLAREGFVAPRSKTTDLRAEEGRHGRSRDPGPAAGHVLSQALARPAAFKAEGDTVAVGDTIGLIEVMKTFTRCTAEAAGQDRRIPSSRTRTRHGGPAALDIEV